jgi:hypothetical protein
MAITMTVGAQEIIHRTASDPVEAVEKMEWMARRTARGRIRVWLQARQHRAVRLTLKVTAGADGEYIVSLPEEAGG